MHRASQTVQGQASISQLSIYNTTITTSINDITAFVFITPPIKLSPPPTQPLFIPLSLASSTY